MVSRQTRRIRIQEKERLHRSQLQGNLGQGDRKSRVIRPRQSSLRQESPTQGYWSSNQSYALPKQADLKLEFSEQPLSSI